MWVCICTQQQKKKIEETDRFFFLFQILITYTTLQSERYNNINYIWKIDWNVSWWIEFKEQIKLCVHVQHCTPWFSINYRVIKRNSNNFLFNCISHGTAIWVNVCIYTKWHFGTVLSFFFLVYVFIALCSVVHKKFV